MLLYYFTSRLRLFGGGIVMDVWCTVLVYNVAANLFQMIPISA